MNVSGCTGCVYYIEKGGHANRFCADVRNSHCRFDTCCQNMYVMMLKSSQNAGCFRFVRNVKED